MPYYPIIIAIIFAILNWISVWKKWTVLEYVTKPATMLALLWWIWLSGGLGGPMLWFTIGVVFCLAGDIFLMIPKDLFIFGLLAFLVGQICYIVGFSDQAPYFNLFGAVIIIILGSYMGWLFPKLSNGLKTMGKKQLLIPVFIYAMVISVMVYSALMTWNRAGWPDVAALFASIGAILFYASDSILAWNRFVKTIPNGRILNMMTYHLGQFGIVFAAILHVTLK